MLRCDFDGQEQNEYFRLPYFAPAAPIFLTSQRISGCVAFTEHWSAIDAVLLGQVRVKSDDSLHQFLGKSTACRRDSIGWKFAFDAERVPSFYGSHFDCRYVLQFLAGRKALAQVPIYILKVDPPCPHPRALAVSLTSPLLELDFFSENGSFDVRGCLIGLLSFRRVRLPIVSVTLEVFRSEAFDGVIIHAAYENTLVGSFEVLDGDALAGDQVPVRLFMGALRLWPWKEARGLRVSYSARLNVTTRGIQLAESIPIQVVRRTG